MMKQATGRAPNLAACILKGIAGAAVVTVLGAMAVAKMVDSEVMPRESIGYGAMVVLLIASFLGAKLAQSGAGNQKTAAGAGGAVGYLLALVLVNVLFFGGGFAGMGTSLLVILLGTGLTLMPMGKGPGKPRKRRYKIPK